MTQRGKFVKTAAQRYLDYKATVGWAGRAAIKKPLTGPVEVAARFYLCGKRLPDLDNLLKAILDGLNKVAWNDDRQVVKVAGERLAVDSPLSERAEIQIREGLRKYAS